MQKELRILPTDLWFERYNIKPDLGRKLLFHRRANGLAQAIIKLNSKLYVDEDRWLQWLEEQRENAI